jgi:hypothetical protein
MSFKQDQLNRQRKKSQYTKISLLQLYSTHHDEPPISNGPLDNEYSILREGYLFNY